MIDFSNITLGNKQVQSVTLGTTLIWPQNLPYTFVLITSSTLQIGSGDTLFSIQLQSSRGSAPIQPTYEIDPYLNDIEAVYEGVSNTGTTYTFTFSCTVNTTVTQRTGQITFTQPGSNNTLSVLVRQARSRV